MSYRNSVTSVPGFWELVLGLGILLFSTMYVGFETGGIIGSISAGLHAIYNIIYGCIFVTYLWMIIAWIFDKWEIITAIGIPITLFILSVVYHKRR
ncbi:hypothetical protein [Methanoregula sp.]|jgi:hypothetical protein|uniref:hypothetical protein n=1 Tax=Methanoregula sp. TaxID=2052170 RepID=UPI003C151422